MSRTFLDHITVTAPTLEIGADFVYKSLGVRLQLGGGHPKMGTHNLFLRLDEEMFLEVIAINPQAEKPNRPRWFDLDSLDVDSPARLSTWVIRTESINSTIELCPESIGEVVPMSRGDANWLISIPKNGSLPEAGAVPSLIQWQTEKHPAANFINKGLSLVKLQVFHPKSKEIASLLDRINLESDKIEVLNGNEIKLVATIGTPQGLRTL